MRRASRKASALVSLKTMPLDVRSSRRPALSLATSRQITNLQRILVKDRGHIFPVNVNDIAYLKSDSKYTGIYVANKTYLVRLGLAELAERLDPQRFVRIHRSVMVNLDFVESMRVVDQSQLELAMRDGSILLANRDASKRLRDMSI